MNEPIKILGIFFTYDQLKSKELNFDLTLNSVRKSLSCWQWRNLTLIGKIQLVKTFAMPKFMYRASLISFDKDTIKNINSVIFNFVWRGKDKIKRLTLISEYSVYGYDQRENTGSRLFTEVKPCWTGLISGWVTI